MQKFHLENAASLSCQLPGPTVSRCQHCLSFQSLLLEPASEIACSWFRHAGPGQLSSPTWAHPGSHLRPTLATQQQVCTVPQTRHIFTLWLFGLFSMECPSPCSSCILFWHNCYSSAKSVRKGRLGGYRSYGRKERQGMDTVTAGSPTRTGPQQGPQPGQDQSGVPHQDTITAGFPTRTGSQPTAGSAFPPTSLESTPAGPSPSSPTGMPSRIIMGLFSLMGPVL